MHQAARVHRAQRLAQARAEPPHGELGQRAVPRDHVGERWPRHVRGRQPGRVVVEARGDNRRGVHAADRPGSGDFAAEAVPELGVAREF